MEYSEFYRCRICDKVLEHVWDDDDFNNDFTQCSQCEGFEFDNIRGSVRPMTPEQAIFIVEMIKTHLDAGATISANDAGVPVLVAESDGSINCGLRIDYSKAHTKPAINGLEA